MADEWWKDFFSGIILDFWKEINSERQTKAEADFILKRLGVPDGAAILDVPCGEGRLSRELASRGYAVTGVDLSTPFLEEGRGRAAEQDLDIRWEHRDMRDLPWTSAFDGAFCFGNSFGYLDDEGNSEFLSAIGRSLKPDAHFILDAGIMTETLLPRLREREWTRVGDFLFLEENRYDHVEGRFYTDYTLVRDGHAETRSASQRLYTYRELVQLLKSAGFADVEPLGSLAGDPFTLSSPQIIFVAKTKG